jgi:cytochrome c553
MKRIIAAAALTIFTAGIAMAADTMTFPAKMGDVSFNHKAHQAQGCTKCHATEAGGKIDGFGKDWAHKTCKGCHTELAKGPTKCGDCHKK